LPRLRYKSGSKNIVKYVLAVRCCFKLIKYDAYYLQIRNYSNKTGNAWLRKSLTVTQFIVAQFFIMATVLVSKQVYYALHKDYGFKKDAIVYLNLPYKNNDAGKKQVFINKLRSIPQIGLVSLGDNPPSSNSDITRDAVYMDEKI